MAKVSFTKLNKIKVIQPITFNLDGEEITVLNYLPLEEKLALIQSVIEQAGDNEEGFYNIVKLQVFYIIEMLKHYTNINFTDKQLENIPKLYDSIYINKIWEKVKQYIPEDECEYIWDNLCNMAREITNYNHSALGIFKLIKENYDAEDFNINNISDFLEKASEPDSLSIVKAALKDIE